MPSLSPLETAAKLTESYGTSECKTWRDEQFRKHPRIAHHLGKKYADIAEADKYIAANRWLLGIHKKLKLGGTGLSLAGSNEELTSYVRAKASKNFRQITEVVNAVGKCLAPSIIRQLIEKMGIEFPLNDNYTQDELISALARVCDEQWLKRKLRTKQACEMEDFLRESGAVYKHKEIYISDFSYQRRREQSQRNQKLLEKLEAVNQEGQYYTLAELAKLSPSNPVIRRAELMVRMRGFEDFAQHSKTPFTGMFYTLTCPSKFHVMNTYGQRNPNYDGSTVRDGQDYLNSIWQCIRASFKRHKIEVFGMRVVEPHHDGTPHWHLLLFMHTEHTQAATKIVRRYAMAMDGNEAGADQYRLKTVEIDPKKGSATGYIAKYIAKNIDGHGVVMDQYGHDAIVSAMRIEAWKATHGFRQFQQIGGASITVWRELRRLEQSDLDPCLLKSLIAAADDADWETYNHLMGGVICARKDRPARPMMIERESSNRYGEVVKKIKGILIGTKSIVTRPYDWIVRLNNHLAEKESMNESSDGVGFGAAISTAPPATAIPLEFCQ